MPLALAVMVMVAFGATQARAETLMQALASAYSYNPVLNAARAGVRATDELIPRWLS